MIVRDVCVSFGEKKVLDGFSGVFTDKITCVMGESGSGKTTLLRVIAGLLEYTGTIEGAPKRPAVMFQEDRLLPWLSALENVEAAGCDRERAAELLGMTELAGEENKLPESLSGGMQRRVALARALAFDSDMLILDEPFKGLDSELHKRMALLVKNAGKPVIIATHDLTDIELLGGEIVRI